MLAPGGYVLSSNVAQTLLCDLANHQPSQVPLKPILISRRTAPPPANEGGLTPVCPFPTPYQDGYLFCYNLVPCGPGSQIS